MIDRIRSVCIARSSKIRLAAIAVLGTLCFASAAHAADVLPGWGQWWLPPDRSAHGHGIDRLFIWIFWITMITFIGVELVLVVFLIKYRHRPERKKAHFTHGNTRLEMAWTLAPALILAILALGSKKVWDDYRYSPSLNDPNRAKVLVIGERFKWNVIYPGPDGKFGRYLVHPKPGDASWPVGPDGSPTMFAGVPGPAALLPDKVMGAITNYNLNQNPLGKDFADPDGKDDNWEAQPGRAMIIPVNRPVEVQLASKDVLHDFFLPNFRVKLDAVPGMRGRLIFTPTMTSKEMEARSRRQYPIEELVAIYKTNPAASFTVEIVEGTPQAEYYKPPRGPAFWRYADAKKGTILRTGGLLTREVVDKLQEAEIKEVLAYQPGAWDLVCEELCGEGHSKMQGSVIVESQQEFDARKWDQPSAPAMVGPTTAPTVAMTNQ